MSGHPFKAVLGLRNNGDSNLLKQSIRLLAQSHLIRFNSYFSPTTTPTPTPTPNSTTDTTVSIPDIDFWGSDAIGISDEPKIKEHLLQKARVSLMSASERFHLELQKVQKDFRTHENDCGSCEVQIAVLTAKIKYLTTHFAQHKKDIHSRRGLEAMLSKRKKLLKYFRRTQWERYCVLIERLGLRDKESN